MRGRTPIFYPWHQTPFILFQFFPLFLAVIIPDLQIGYTDYRDTAAFVDTPKEVYCDTETNCVCSQKAKGYFLHCEMEMHADLIYGLSPPKLFVHCNETITNEKTRDIHRAMQLWRYEELGVQLKECPETSCSMLSTAEEQKPTITSLTIDCGARKEFRLDKEHLSNLRGLRAVKLTCKALLSLPEDLFAGQWPELRTVSIIDTGVEAIPESLFSQLRRLESLILRGNRIKSLGQKHFVGLKSLKEFRLMEHGLASLDEDVFRSIVSLERLEISFAKLTKLPDSIQELKGLKIISIVENMIESIHAENCKSLSNIDDVSIVNNFLKEIHPECYSSFKSAKNIDLSGNHLSELPTTRTKMDGLRTFKLQHNSKPILRVSQFLESDSMEELIMNNSSIQSIEPGMLHLLPNLTSVDLRDNKIRDLDEKFFAFNLKLQRVFFDGNQLSSIAPGLLFANPLLYVAKFPRNNISILPSIFSDSSILITLDLSENNLEYIHSSALSNLSNLNGLFLSHNKIRNLSNGSFSNLEYLGTLVLEDNLLTTVNSDTFLAFKDSEQLSYLHLGNNTISTLSQMEIPSVEILYLSNNMLTHLEHGVFHKLTALKHLILSNNKIVELPNSTLVTYYQQLIYLDLSFNLLSEIPDNAFKEVTYVTHLYLQGNKFQKFYWRWIERLIELIELDLSRNGLQFLDCNYKEFVPIKGKNQYITPAVKILKLSDNDLSFNSTSWMFDEVRKTWGRVSPLSCFVDVEELHLANNSIAEIFMDWRNVMPKLQLLDLRKNKFTSLKHQELMYSSVFIDEKGKAHPYDCKHKLKIDLRYNFITGIEIPSSMIMKNGSKYGAVHGHATIFLDKNPFSCGCGILQFLRLVNEDIVLTGELFRTEGKSWMLPAKINVGNLSCSQPISILGKKITDPETWIHHLLPLNGLCAAFG